MRPASVVSVLVDKKEEANSIHTNTTAAGSFQLTGTFVMFSNTIVLFPLPLSSLDSFPYVTAHILPEARPSLSSTFSNSGTCPKRDKIEASRVQHS
jgi:hypothetical protein